MKKITDGIKRIDAILLDIADLEQRQALVNTELTELERNGDLDEKGIVDKIIRHQAVSALLPRRIENRRADLQAADEALLADCHAAITGDISPRLRNLDIRVRKTVRSDLEMHIADERALDEAVSSSKTVLEIARLSVANRMADPRLAIGGTVKEYANQLVKVSDAVASIESSLK